MGCQQAYSISDLDFLEQLARAEARDSFWAFRQYMHPDLLLGWFQKETASHLQQFYEDLIAGKRPILLIQAPPQHGKLCADHTDVFTPSGWRKHGDLRPGDYVYHPSGRAIMVTHTSDKHPAQMRVELTNGEVIWCHELHEWTVYNRNKKRYETLETQEMLTLGRRSDPGRNPLYTGVEGKRGCHYTYQLPLTDSLHGESKSLPIHPYALGAWLGDGSQTKPCITHDKQDQPIVDGIVDCGFDITNSHTHKDTGVITTYFGINMTKGLREAGVFAEAYGVRNKHIPDAYLSASIDQRLELLAGLIDTDGYVYQRNGRTVFTTADKRLADTFCELVSTFGWSFSLVTEKPKLSSSGIQGKSDYYVIGFNPDMEIPCRLPRKVNTKTTPARRRVAIKSIEKHDVGYVGNCITVDSDDGLYLVGRTMQPTHNSVQIVDFIAWLAGKRPDVKSIYTSFSGRLGTRANLSLQRMFDSYKYGALFPDTRIIPTRNADKAIRNLRNREILEFVDKKGYFRNTTVGGPVTGEELDLGIIDDPIKGREAANSITIRDKAWDWLTDDFMSRFSDHAGLLGIMTRWNVDDPFGRLMEIHPGCKVLKFPALASEDTELMDCDPREPGSNEPLFPKHKSLEFLLERKNIMHISAWESLFQQNPIILGGNLFQSEHWRYYKAPPRIVHRVIYADTAQKSKQQNDRSVFECWGKSEDGKAVLLDLIKGRWEAPELLTNARAFWNKHLSATGQGKLRGMRVEDKVSGTGLIQTLQREGIPVTGIPRRADKVERALDVIPSIEAGLVLIPEDAEWLSEFLTECSQFPNGKHDDQVDPMMDAIDEMLVGSGNQRTAGVW